MVGIVRQYTLYIYYIPILIQVHVRLFASDHIYIYILILLCTTIINSRARNIGPLNAPFYVYIHIHN